MDVLPEVSVADAEGAVADIFRSIMESSGTGTPALIIRHFAVFPGFLEWTWQAVGDELDGGRIILHALDAVDRTPKVSLPALSTDDLRSAGVDGSGEALLRAILASYNRMNPMNYSLIATVRTLLAEPDGAPGAAMALPEPTPRSLAPCRPLPPPVAVADMPEDLQRTMVDLSDAIPQGGARLVPTLYRHMALWPDLVRQVAPAVLAAIRDGRVTAAQTRLQSEMAPLIAAVTARARRKGLPPVPLPDPAAMVRTLDSFLTAIPQMTVIGTALETAMPPEGGGGRGAA